MIESTRRAPLPIITHLLAAYKLWHGYLPNIPKDARYTLGAKIDALFIETAEPLFAATYLNREEKCLPYLRKALPDWTRRKFFLQALWEIRALDNKKYAALSGKAGRDRPYAGGWTLAICKNKTLPRDAREKRSE